MACSAGFGIDGITLRPGDHVCGLFFGWLDRDRLLAPFFRTGLRAGDRCVIVTDRTDATPILRQLGTAEETTGWLASGQLQVQTSDELPEHAAPGLDHDQMLAMFSQAVDVGPGPSGFLRIGGEVSWWGPTAAAGALARYESELNSRVDEQTAVLCLYDLSRFSADAIVEAVLTHPVLIVGDRVVSNPWYEPPGGAGGDSEGPARRRPTVGEIAELVTPGRLDAPFT